MSEERLKAFLAIVKLDDSLKARIKEASNVDQFVALGKELGYFFSIDDLKALIEEELTDDDLDKVRGGRQGYVEAEMILLIELKNKLN